MDQDTTRAEGMTIGLDIGDRHCWFCVLDSDGRTQEEGRIPTTSEAIRRSLGTRPRTRIALEVGTQSPWISRLLTECGHEVLVANPCKLRMIYENDKKSDRVDAEWLARLARVDPRLLAPISHRSPQFQADLAVLRSRDALIKARTQLVNHVRGSVKAFGGRIPKCSTRSFGQRFAEQIPEPLRPALLAPMEMIASLSVQIGQYDWKVENMAEKRYPETQRLRQIAGVGPLTAVAYILTIEDPRRFRRSRTLGAYLGLRPRRDQSGQQSPQLRITKAGDVGLRRLLVTSAHYILGPFGPDTDLRRMGLAMAARGGKSAKKRALVAVARKLAVLLHHLWISGEVYEPLRNAEAKRGRKTTAA